MNSDGLWLEISVFGLALWLGLYLIGRDLQSVRLRLAGLGLVSFGLGWGLEVLGNYADSPALAQGLARWRWPCFFLPAIFWTGAIIYLLPEDKPLRASLIRVWRYALLPVSLLILVIAISTGQLFDPQGNQPSSTLAYGIFVMLILLPLLGALGIMWQSYLAGQTTKGARLMVVATIFFGLSTFLLIFPRDWLPRPWLLGMVGFDLELLGLAIALLDAFDQGEAFLPDFLRSLAYAFFTVLLFGGQIILAIGLATGPTPAMVFLLLATCASAITVQVFATQLGGWLDRLALARFPRLRKARANLRETANALPRLNPAPDLSGMEEAEFQRLTRRALSHFGDLPRLAASSLIYLPQLETRLVQRGANPTDSLERTIELKALLAESVARLKPRGKGDFGTSDEWRHYNALYFPYIAGLKPYSLRAHPTDLDPATKAALDWFRTSVPERTLYNWQTTAARLVAQDLQRLQAESTNPYSQS